ncbi:hypothetical protein PQX77_007618 [Marasmius sp. AFHP31]|nr:hypothetical protein PQX77_007618 [Marasmius sp. AFHP31]
MISDEDSVLTDLEDELEDDEEEYSTTQKKKRGRGTYKLRNALRPPRATTYTAQALYEQIHNGDIELDPEYQRGVVWHRDKQVKLIDSILRNFYIPPIIFAYECDDDGTEKRTCIDGKQRLTSIHLFMEGIIPHKDSYTGEQLWYKDNGGGKTKKTILPDKYRTIFANKQIVCVEYQELRDKDERDIFSRVQLGMALTAAEKMNVISTPRADFIRLLLSRFLTEKSLGNPEIPWAHARGTDFKCFALSVYCISKPAQTTFSGTVQLENWLAETKGDSARGGKSSGKKDDDDWDQRQGVPLAEPFKKKVIETFEVVCQLANDKKYNQAFRSCPAADKISPVEMVAIPVLVYHVYVSPPSSSPARGDNRVTLQRLCDLILILRAYLHKNHKDVRLNSRVGKDMLEFCIKASKDPNQFFQENSGLLSWKGLKTTASRISTKRKKAPTREDPDADEYEEAPIRTTTRSRAMQGARKSTGGRPPSTRSAAAAASSSVTDPARDSPPNPQMLPSPGPNSTPINPAFPSISQAGIKRESDPPGTVPSQTQQTFSPTGMTQWDLLQQNALLTQVMNQQMQQMDPAMVANMMSRIGQQSQYPYPISQPPGGGQGPT